MLTNSWFSNRGKSSRFMVFNCLVSWEKSRLVNVTNSALRLLEWQADGRTEVVCHRLPFVPFRWLTWKFKRFMNIVSSTWPLRHVPCQCSFWWILGRSYHDFRIGKMYLFCFKCKQLMGSFDMTNFLNNKRLLFKYSHNLKLWNSSIKLFQTRCTGRNVVTKTILSNVLWALCAINFRSFDS